MIAPYRVSLNPPITPSSVTLDQITLSNENVLKKSFQLSKIWGALVFTTFWFDKISTQYLTEYNINPKVDLANLNKNEQDIIMHHPDVLVILALRLFMAEITEANLSAKLNVTLQVTKTLSSKLVGEIVNWEQGLETRYSWNKNDRSEFDSWKKILSQLQSQQNKIARQNQTFFLFSSAEKKRGNVTLSNSQPFCKIL